MSSQAIGMVLLAVVEHWLNAQIPVRRIDTFDRVRRGTAQRHNERDHDDRCGLDGPARHAVVSPRGSRLVIRRMAR